MVYRNLMTLLFESDQIVWVLVLARVTNGLLDRTLHSHHPSCHPGQVL